MARKAQKKYGPGGQYYRKRLPKPGGGYKDVYGATLGELSEKVEDQKRIWEAEAAAALAKPPAGEMYVFEYAAAWYARNAPGMSEGQRLQKQYQINKVICPVIGGKLLKEVTSDDIADVMATRASLGRSAQQKTVTVLRAIFEAAEDAGAIERLPTRRLRPGGKDGMMPDALTVEQEQALLRAVEGLAVEPCVRLALYAGLRREEICALTWRNVRLDGPTAFLRVRAVCVWPGNNQPVIKSDPKSVAGWRTIPLPDVLRHYLRNLKAEQLAALRIRGKKSSLEEEAQREALLAPRCVYGAPDGTPLSMTAFRRRWDTIRARSTASGRAMGEKSRNHHVEVVLDFWPTPHLLRHTYITRLILGKMDLKRVQYLAGHSDPQVTLKIYTALMGHMPEDLIDDVNSIFSPPQITP